MRDVKHALLTAHTVAGKADIATPDYILYRYRQRIELSKRHLKKKNEVGAMVLFGSDFRKYFGVFLGSSCRETAKNAIKKIEGKRRQEKKSLSQLFRPKVFDMDFPQFVLGVFLNSPC
jgi:hypothetical protein